MRYGKMPWVGSSFKGYFKFNSRNFELELGSKSRPDMNFIERLLVNSSLKKCTSLSCFERGKAS